MNRSQSDQQDKKQEETVAQFIQERFDNDIPARVISDGVTDYVFRCIQGPFAGNFIYLNLTEEGELIGSDPQADYTLLIENAGVYSKHSKINYIMDENQYGYFIKDLDSDKGTWIKTKPGHLIQIEDEQIFRIEDQIFQFRLIEDENFDVVVEWLARIELKKVIIKLKSYNIKTLKDIKQLQPNIIDEIIDDEDEKLRFKQAFDTIDQDFPVDGKQKTLLIYSNTQDEVLAKVKWSGAAITRSSEIGEISGIDKYGVDCNQKFEMIIQFYFNRYYFHVTPKAPGQIYLKLQGNYKLSPDDIVNIGSLDFQVQRFNTGLWSDKGTRMTMEDRSVISQSIPISRNFSVSYFAVYDGHGGDQCAQFLFETVGEKLKEEFMNSEDYLDDTETFYSYIYEKLVYIINDVDQQFWQYRMNDQDNNSDSGSAGVIVLIFGTKIISVNVGDCRAVLSRQGRPVALTVDHKPNEEKEKQRIIKSGGTVDGNRVNKKLAVSRAFGDFSFKKETTGNMDIVTVNPDIRVWDIDFMVDEFIVLGCDGLYDIFNNQQVVDYVREKLLENKITEQDPQKVARQICLDAVEISKQQKRGSDNCSVIIILLTRGIVNQDNSHLQ